jgi:predicted SAM-dependent methyltransferase
MAKRLKSHNYIFCNGCSAFRKVKTSKDLREGLKCKKCGLNARQRAVLYAVSNVIKKQKRYFDSLNIIGVSDGSAIASVLADRFDEKYKNYEYHFEPSLDVTQVPEALSERASIVICSEVLEHVQPPVDLAFAGLHKILKPGGFLVLSVPHGSLKSQHIEHFPVMKNTEIVEFPSKIFRGVDLEGKMREFSDLIFHGGAGSTLEFRVFSENSLRNYLERAGFTNIKVQANKKIIGASWEPWSRVWTAQKE